MAERLMRFFFHSANDEWNANGAWIARVINSQTLPGSVKLNYPKSPNSDYRHNRISVLRYERFPGKEGNLETLGCLFKHASRESLSRERCLANRCKLDARARNNIGTNYE